MTIVNEAKLRQELQEALDPLVGTVDSMGKIATAVDDILRPYREEYPDKHFEYQLAGSILELTVRTRVDPERVIEVNIIRREVRFCGNADAHARHEWYDGPYDEPLIYVCHGAMICPVDAWNGNADALVKYRTALEKIAEPVAGGATYEGPGLSPWEMRKIADEALGRKP